MPPKENRKSMTIPSNQARALRRENQRDRQALRTGQTGQQRGPSFHAAATAVQAVPVRQFVQAEDGSWRIQ